MAFSVCGGEEKGDGCPSPHSAANMPMGVENRSSAASSTYGSKASSEAGDPAARGSRIGGLADGVAKQHMFNSHGMGAMTATSWYNQSGAFANMKTTIDQQWKRGLVNDGNFMDQVEKAQENISAQSAAASAARLAQLGDSPDSIADTSGSIAGQDEAKRVSAAKVFTDQGEKAGKSGEWMAAQVARIGTGKDMGEKLGFAAVAKLHGMEPAELGYTLGQFGSEKNLQGVYAADAKAKAAGMPLEDYLRSSQSMGAYVDPVKGEVHQAVTPDGKIVFSNAKTGNSSVDDSSKTVKKGLGLSDGTQASPSTAAFMARHGSDLLMNGLQHDDARRWQVAGEISGGMVRKDTGKVESIALIEGYLKADANLKWGSDKSWIGKAIQATTGASADASVGAGAKAVIMGRDVGHNSYDRMQAGIKTVMDGAYSDYDTARTKGYKGSADKFAADRVKEFVDVVDNDVTLRKHFGISKVGEAITNAAGSAMNAAGSAMKDMKPVMAMTPDEQDANAEALKRSMKGRM